MGYKENKTCSWLVWIDSHHEENVYLLKLIAISFFFKELFKNSDNGLTTSSWKFNNENILALGAIDGSITILDIRNIGATTLHESVPFPNGVHKLLFNPDGSNQLAGCCDSTEIKEFDTSDDLCKTIFEKSAHTVLCTYNFEPFNCAIIKCLKFEKKILFGFACIIYISFTFHIYHLLLLFNLKTK